MWQVAQSPLDWAPNIFRSPAAVSTRAVYGITMDFSELLPRVELARLLADSKTGGDVPELDGNSVTLLEVK